jgi:tRNA (adenine57-N1/adenine58-N1)-methyltransferase
MMQNLAQANELVLLVGSDDKRFFVRLVPGASFHTHHGFIKHDQIIGQPFGGTVRTHSGHPYLLLQVSLFQQIMRVKRATAIVYPKEIGYILLKINAVNGARIVEAGTGSGALTLALARAVAPDGHVFTYEERTDMQSLARKNLESAGALANVTMKLRNIAEGFDESDADATFLDVREPQDFLGQVRRALKGGGFFGAIVPTTNQVQNLLAGLLQGGWAQIEVEELLMRPYKIVPERLRPDDRMVAHTGYLIFARKVDDQGAVAPMPIDDTGAGEADDEPAE